MSTYNSSDSELLVSPSWVHSRLYSQTEQPIVILDGSWHMPSAGRDPLAEFHRKHIPKADFFGIDQVKDKTTDLPHMLPSVDDFCRAAANLNITPKSHIVIYDTVGMFSACRVYWTFRVFNHPGPISVLNGGLPNWIESGFDVESTQVREEVDLNDHREKMVQELRRVYSLNKNLVWTYDQVVANIKHQRENLEYAQVLDARSPGRFNGTDPEPRQGLSSGHMPFSISVPFQSLLQAGTDDANVGVRFLERKYHPQGSATENSHLPQQISPLPKPRPSVTEKSLSENEADACDVLPETPVWSVRSLLPPSPSVQSNKGVSTTTQVDAERLLRLANLRTPSADHVQGLSRDVSSLCHFVEHIKAVDVSNVDPLERLGENWGCPLREEGDMSVNQRTGSEKPTDVEEESGRALLKKAQRVEETYYVVDNAIGDTSAGTRLLAKYDIREVLESVGVDLEKPIVTSCGSGITASVLFFALELAGAKGPLAVYDRPWTEYASLKGIEIVKAK